MSPPSGWVQVTRIKSTGEIFHQRLHGDRTCAEASVRDRIAAEAAKGRDVESYLSDHMTYAQARRLEKFSCCKCSGRPGDHKVTPPIVRRATSSSAPRHRSPTLAARRTSGIGL